MMPPMIESEVEEDEEMEDRCIYFNYGSEQEGEQEEEEGSYAVTMSGDESFKPKETEDEAESEQESEEDEAGDEEEMQESGGEESAGEEVESEDERTKNRWLKEWTLAGKVANYFIMEVVNVTNLAMQMETVILSKAKVIFFQEHKVRRKDLPKIRKRLREKGWAIHCGPCDETGRRASAGVGG